jgi:hypothetical protein
MEVIPLLTSCQFAKLAPGDLFALHHGSGSYIALAVKDPRSLQDPNADRKMALILGPSSSEAPRVPILISLSPQTRIVSFGKDYRLRLPCEPKAWLFVEPWEESHCLVLTADKPLMRANFAGQFDTAQCYVDIKEGLLITDPSGNFENPRGDCTYTLKWTFETTEEVAQEIISAPPSTKHSQQHG